jgi:hypothetical protein
VVCVLALRVVRRQLVEALGGGKRSERH